MGVDLEGGHKGGRRSGAEFRLLPDRDARLSEQLE